MARAFSGLLLIALGCTELAPGDELLDSGTVDAGEDARDAAEDTLADVPVDTPDATDCFIPPDAECPPLCARTVEILGDDVIGNVRLVAADKRLTCDVLYRMPAPTFVESGATLSIAPGVIIEASSRGYLVVESGAQIDAQGTAELPIVFTSADEEPAPGDWGGLLLFGDAPVNTESGSTMVYDPLDEDRAVFGGSDDTHDCGTLRYVRIEFGGSLNRFIVPEDFVGLALGGCGTETELDYIQLHATGGEGTQFVGGEFDVRHMMMTEHRDDGINWNRGWHGTIQYLIVHSRGDNDNNAIEGRVSEFPLPSIGPPVANATLINPYMEARPAMYVTAASGMQGFNILVWGSRAGMLVFESTLTNPGFFDRDYFTLESVIVDDAIPFAEDTPVLDRMGPPLRGNRSTDPMLDPSVLIDDLTDPNFQPNAAGPANTGAFGDLTPFGLETTDYIGAVDPDGEDWTLGWTRY